VNSFSRQIRAAAQKIISHLQREYEVGLVTDLLAHGENFIDIGANKGTYIYAALRANATVQAIEPIPELANHMRNLFKDEEVEVLEYAVANSTGEMELHIPLEKSRRVSTRASLSPVANIGFQLEKIIVKVAPLEHLVNAADLIKIDVEGNEFEVLKSSIPILTTQHPTIIFEAEVRHHPDNPHILKQCFSLLESNGYSGLFISPHDRKQLLPIAKFDLGKHQRVEANKKVGSLRQDPNYVNNFLFIHESRHADIIARALTKGWKLKQD